MQPPGSYEKFEEVPNGRTKLVCKVLRSTRWQDQTGMKSFKKYLMAGPDWYEKVEEVPNGRTRPLGIFQKFHIRPTLTDLGFRVLHK
jgi:hypothetical protein